jgi:hypothetical protein
MEWGEGVPAGLDSNRDQKTRNYTEREMEQNPAERIEKLCRVWSSRQEREIALRVYFTVREAGGCRVYELLREDYPAAA